MNIAIDYDGTITALPGPIAKFMENIRAAGHRVTIVTMRRLDEPIGDVWVKRSDEVIYTSRKAKLPYIRSLGLKFDMWLDDQPNYLFEDG